MGCQFIRGHKDCDFGILMHCLWEVRRCSRVVRDLLASSAISGRSFRYFHRILVIIPKLRTQIPNTCLRIYFRYEELAKRYQILVQAYEDQCNAVGLCDKRLDQWRERANSTQAHLTHAHKTLIAVGEKYLALKNKCNLKVCRIKSIQHKLKATESTLFQFQKARQKPLTSQCFGHLFFELARANFSLCMTDWSHVTELPFSLVKLKSQITLSLFQKNFNNKIFALARWRYSSVRSHICPIV